MEAKLRGDKVLVTDGLELYEESGYGSPRDGVVMLSLEEALYLTERGKIEVRDDGEALGFEELLKHAKQFAFDIFVRYQVYKDLRSKGLVVRSGLKYGTHFRIYERGVKPRKGARAPWEHAKFLAHALSEGAEVSLPELSRFVRLSHSVKKRLWVSVVDSEGDVTYYQVTRVTP